MDAVARKVRAAHLHVTSTTCVTQTLRGHLCKAARGDSALVEEVAIGAALAETVTPMCQMVDHFLTTAEQEAEEVATSLPTGPLAKHHHRSLLAKTMPTVPLR